MCGPDAAEAVIKSFLLGVALSVTLVEALIVYLCRRCADKLHSPLEIWSKAKLGNAWLAIFSIDAVFLIAGYAAKGPVILIIFLSLLAGPQLMRTLKRAVA